MAEKINDGGPAFPTIHGYVDSFGSLKQKSDGLSLRDWFAGQALIGLLSSRESQLALYKDASAEGADTADYVAESVYEMADAMLLARQSSKAEPHHPHTAEKVTQGGKSE